ncbi:hypothetical protein [Sphingomonas sp. LaA6.9]|uniref:hypothetical protein n=1 Tax=Sphingomonas sp. LaA6.9 TaxID=2919914 RepID=UPI001F5023E8|nr:hypothetical protein [Sphingomonas sp. LaA6.9]MCJ8159404.1 hypothetical protein [Sphingomonas sp. LaA6.9]
MKILKIILIAFGILAFLMGVLWMGQGTGYIRWPASSFMIDMSEWTIRGAGLAVAGLVAVIVARRLL